MNLNCETVIELTFQMQNKSKTPDLTIGMEGRHLVVVYHHLLIEMIYLTWPRVSRIALMHLLNHIEVS